MSILLAHKIELRPTSTQEQFLDRSAGCKRFVWNRCLAEWNDAYKRGFKPDKGYMLFYYKCLREKYPWLHDVSMNNNRLAVYDLVDTWIDCFKGRCKPPRFKKKGQRDSFAVRQSDKFKADGRLLKIEKLKSRILMRQKVRFDGQCRQATMSKTAGKWFVSILVKIPANPFTHKMPSENQVGIDIGVRKMAVLSDGTVFPANQVLKKYLNKLVKLQKQLSKKVRGSNRYKEMNHRIAKLHYHIKCKRIAVAHEFTDYVASNYKRIVLEDLNISGMVKNKKLARCINDVGMFEIRRQLEYKAKLRGCELIFIDRFFPSSKTCSKCGFIHKDLGSSETYLCPDCGHFQDRDLNAAINILNHGVDTLEPTEKRTQESQVAEMVTV